MIGPQQLLDDAYRLLAGDAQAALDCATAVLERPDVPAESSLAGQAFHVAGMARYTLGHVPQGSEALRHAVELLQRHGPRLAECRAWRDLGSGLTHLAGDLHGGVQALQRARALAEGDPHEEGLVLSRLGPALGRLDHLDEAEAALQGAVQRLTGGPDARALVLALDNLGFLQLERGRYEQALQPLRAALDLIDPQTQRLHLVNARSNLAIALAGVGRHDEALQLLQACGALLDPATDGYQWADHRLCSGRVHLLCGQPEQARAVLQQGLDYARQHGLASAEIDLLRWLSEAEEGRGDLAAALARQRELRSAERRWLDEAAASRVRQLEAGIEVARRRAENQALARARDELEARVAERTEALRLQVQERQSAETLARFWADHDWLTQLPNRRLLQTRLREALVRARREGQSLGVLFVDMDGFKAVNDSHGHLSGDRLLRLTARRLLRQCPPDATVTRYGGDEFVVVLPGLADEREPAALAHRLCKAVMQPLRLNQRRVSLSCSIGVAIGPHDAQTPDELVRVADRAMRVAKSSGRNQVCQLDARGQERLDRRGRLRRELGQAIASDGLSAVFQPVWHLREQRLAGVELLARWHDATLGAVSPAEFIPLAEESGADRRAGPVGRGARGRWRRWPCAARPGRPGAQTCAWR